MVLDAGVVVLPLMVGALVVVVGSRLLADELLGGEVVVELGQVVARGATWPR